MEMGSGMLMAAGSPTVSSGRENQSAWVRYGWTTGAILVLCVGENRIVKWTYQPLDPRERQDGHQIEWADGHLVSMGEEGDALFALMRKLNLSFPLVDAHLRGATGYEEPLPAASR